MWHYYFLANGYGYNKREIIEHRLLNPESNRERFEEIHKKGYLPALKELLKLYSNARDYPIETGFKDEQRPLVISALQSIIETKEASASSRAAPSPMKI